MDCWTEASRAKRASWMARRPVAAISAVGREEARERWRGTRGSLGEEGEIGEGNLRIFFFLLDYSGCGVPEDGAMETEHRWSAQAGAEELAWVRTMIEAHPQWSRKEIARELCRAWGWRDGMGRLKDFAARSLLLKLEAARKIRLPALRYRRPRRWAWNKGQEERPVEPAALMAGLGELRPLRLVVVRAGSPEYERWRHYLGRHHYLGLRVVGENLGYLVVDRGGRDVACLLFGAAAWKCAPRDRFLEWRPEERAKRLAEVANNTRFLILPWVRVPHLASHVLGLVARRIDADWRAKYGHGLLWLETFVEKDRFRGSCYRGANWRLIGHTTGRSRQDRVRTLRVPVKDVYVYALSEGGR